MTQQGTFGTVVERVWSTDSSGRKRLVARVEHGDSADGTYLTSLAGSPAGGAFGTERIVDAEPGCACKFVRTGGGVWAFGGDGAHRVPGLPPPALLARWDRNVALVPLVVSAPTDTGGAPRPRPRVEIRSLSDSSMISSFDSPQPIDDLALTKRYVFTIAGYAKSTQLQVHDPATGALIRAVRAQSLRYLDQVGVTRPLTFSAAGHWAVYGQSHSVWAVDGATGKVSRVTHTTWSVRDVSTDGETVSWIEVRRVPGAGNKPPREQWLSRILTATLSQR
jgi:hypothetical protein